MTTNSLCNNHLKDIHEHLMHLTFSVYLHHRMKIINVTIIRHTYVASKLLEVAYHNL